MVYRSIITGRRVYLHSIWFPRDQWNLQQIKIWLKKHRLNANLHNAPTGYQTPKYPYWGYSDSSIAVVLNPKERYIRFRRQWIYSRHYKKPLLFTFGIVR